MQKVVVLQPSEPLARQLQRLIETTNDRIVSVSPAFSLRPGAQPRFDGYIAVVEGE